MKQSKALLEEAEITMLRYNIMVDILNRPVPFLGQMALHRPGVLVA